MTDLRQDKNYARYMKLLGWKVVEIEGVYYYLKKLPLLGYICKIQRPEKSVNGKNLQKLAGLARVFAIYLEAASEKQVKVYERELGFKRTKSSSLPSKTVRIDLQKKVDELLSDMHYKTRYNIKLAAKLGVKINCGKNVKRFARFWQECALKRGMFLPMKKEIAAIYQAFGKDAQIYNAYYKKQLVAAVLTVATPTSVYYMYAASSIDGKKVFAPTALVWEIIRNAKREGKKYFDFEGIYDERYPLKSWKGFSRFKKSFGGVEVLFPGTIRKYACWRKAW